MQLAVWAWRARWSIHYKKEAIRALEEQQFVNAARIQKAWHDRVARLYVAVVVEVVV